ncbi:MAG: PaaI family thioesterase [Rhizomicrobium sp.]
MDKIGEPPAGFAPHFRKSPLTDPWEPLYSRKADGVVLLGTWLRPPHTNARGFAHGGLISALADNAMGLSCVEQTGGATSFVTVNLAVDFLGSARIGQWLEIATAFVRLGKTLSFAQCFVTADGEPIARANATFRAVPRV